MRIKTFKRLLFPALCLATYSKRQGVRVKRFTVKKSGSRYKLKAERPPFLPLTVGSYHGPRQALKAARRMNGCLRQGKI